MIADVHDVCYGLLQQDCANRQPSCSTRCAISTNVVTTVAVYMCDGFNNSSRRSTPANGTHQILMFVAMCVGREQSCLEVLLLAISCQTVSEDICGCHKAEAKLHMVATAHGCQAMWETNCFPDLLMVLPETSHAALHQIVRAHHSAVCCTVRVARMRQIIANLYNIASWLHPTVLTGAEATCGNHALLTCKYIGQRYHVKLHGIVFTNPQQPSASTTMRYKTQK